MSAENLVSADARNGRDIPFFRLNFQGDLYIISECHRNFFPAFFRILRFAQMISALGQSCRDLRDISGSPVTRDCRIE